MRTAALTTSPTESVTFSCNSPSFTCPCANRPGANRPVHTRRGKRAFMLHYGIAQVIAKERAQSSQGSLDTRHPVGRTSPFRDWGDLMVLSNLSGTIE